MKWIPKGWGLLIGATLAALVMRWTLFESYVIPTNSMLPALLTNDHIFVNKLIYGLRVPLTEFWLLHFTTPKKGEVIVFKYPRDASTFFIKRVIGEPGDKIEIQNGNLFVNSLPVEHKIPSSPNEFDQVQNSDLRLDASEADSKENYIPFTEILGGKEYPILLRRDDPVVQFGPVTVPAGNLFVLGDNRHNSSDSRVWGLLPINYVMGRASRVWLSCEKTLPLVNFLCTPFAVRWNRFFKRIE